MFIIHAMKGFVRIDFKEFLQHKNEGIDWNIFWRANKQNHKEAMGPTNRPELRGHWFSTWEVIDKERQCNNIFMEFLLFCTLQHMHRGISSFLSCWFHNNSFHSHRPYLRSSLVEFDDQIDGMPIGTSCRLHTLLEYFLTKITKQKNHSIVILTSNPPCHLIESCTIITRSEDAPRIFQIDWSNWMLIGGLIDIIKILLMLIIYLYIDCINYVC